MPMEAPEFAKDLLASAANQYDSRVIPCIRRVRHSLGRMSALLFSLFSFSTYFSWPLGQQRWSRVPAGIHGLSLCKQPHRPTCSWWWFPCLCQPWLIWNCLYEPELSHILYNIVHPKRFWNLYHCKICIVIISQRFCCRCFPYQEKQRWAYYLPPYQSALQGVRISVFHMLLLTYMAFHMYVWLKSILSATSSYIAKLRQWYIILAGQYLSLIHSFNRSVVSLSHSPFFVPCPDEQIEDGTV